MRNLFPSFLSASFILLFFLLCLHPVFAGASISGPAQGRLSGMFEPGKVLRGDFQIGGAERVDAIIDGDLKEYATLDDPQPGGPPRTITVTLVLPQELTPGDHLLYVIAQEIPKNPGMVGGIAATAKQISISVLWDEPLIRVNGFTVESVAVGDPSARLEIKVQSLTKRDLTLFADFTLLDGDGNELSTGRTDTAPLPSGATATLTGSVPTRSLTPGPYGVKGVVRYASNATEVETSFRVGTLELFLEEHTLELAVDTINRFDFTVRSNWNQPLPRTHGIVRLGSLSEQSADITIGPFGTETMKAYLDTRGLSPGQLEGDILVRYPGGERSFPITVLLTEGAVAASVQAKAEQQEAKSWTFTVTPTLILYFALILLVILNLFLLLRRKGGERTEERPKG